MAEVKTKEYKKYKLVYDTGKAINGSLSGIPSEKDTKIVDGHDVKDFKLVYEKEGNIMGSKKNIPTSDDTTIKSIKAMIGEEVEIPGAAPDEKTVKETAPAQEQPSKEPAAKADKK